MQQLTVKLRLRDKHAAELNRQARAVNRVCKIGAGSFNQDARGRWYINLPIELERASETPNKRIGIDLGLKALATLSDGSAIRIPQFYRKSEAKLATAQRGRKTPKRIRNIHAKIADTVHHRDTNAAKNILRAGLSTLVEGASTATPGLRSLGLQAEE